MTPRKRVATNQLGLFGDEAGASNERPVNVSSVPQLSPFRYPGGKTWLIPVIRNWLAVSTPKPRLLVEPFAGGGIVSLTAVAEGLVERALMIELDHEVAAVWKTILSADSVWLATEILSFECTRENVGKKLSENATITKEIAFQTIIKNRTFHGGVMARGSGLIKSGENGKGISSRWYPETLARRIQTIYAMRERIDFVEGNAFDALETYENQGSTVFFIDPPYTAAGKKAGKRLYRHHELDHERLFAQCARLRGSAILTYDDADGVRDLASRYGFTTKVVYMQNRHLRSMPELVIGKNLDWLPDAPGR